MTDDDVPIELQLEIADAASEVERQGHLCIWCARLREAHPDWPEDDYPLLHAVFHAEDA